MNEDEGRWAFSTSYPLYILIRIDATEAVPRSVGHLLGALLCIVRGDPNCLIDLYGKSAPLTMLIKKQFIHVHQRLCYTLILDFFTKYNLVTHCYSLKVCPTKRSVFL